MGWSRKRVGPLQELDPCLLGNRIRNEIHSNLQKEGKKERNKPGLPLWLRYKASAYNVGDLGSIPGLGRPPEEGNGNPLQYSGLENPTDGRISQATVHGVTESWTRLSDFTFFTFCARLCRGHPHIPSPGPPSLMDGGFSAAVIPQPLLLGQQKPPPMMETQNDK